MTLRPALLGLALAVSAPAMAQTSVTVRLTAAPEQREAAWAQIPGLPPIFLEMREAVDGIQEHDGIDISSVEHIPIAERPDLLHLRWLDVMHGNGCHQSAYYRVVSRTKPHQTVISGSIPISGRGGAGTGSYGAYAIAAHSNGLRLTRHTIHWDTMTAPGPLTVPEPLPGNHVERHRREIDTKLVQTFSPVRSGMAQSDCRVRYHPQSDAQALSAIAQCLELERRWISAPSEGDVSSGVVEFRIPDAERERRYPSRSLPDAPPH